MLILSRNKGQKILIGDGIEVTVLRMKGNQVQIGITAPVDVVVLREEVALRNAQAENAQAEKQGA